MFNFYCKRDSKYLEIIRLFNIIEFIFCQDLHKKILTLNADLYSTLCANAHLLFFTNYAHKDNNVATYTIFLIKKTFGKLTRWFCLNCIFWYKNGFRKFTCWDLKCFQKYGLHGMAQLTVHNNLQHEQNASMYKNLKFWNNSCSE